MQRQMKPWAVLTVLALLLFPLACSEDDGTISPSASADEFSLVAQIGESYLAAYTTPTGDPVEIEAASVWALLSDPDPANDPYILDWRSSTLFELGHLKGAHRVSLPDFERVLGSIPNDRTVLNVCATGHDASQVTAFMNMLGIPAQTLRFGMSGWTSERRVNQGRWEDAIGDEYAGWLRTTPTTPTKMHELPALQTGRSTGREILRQRAADYLARGTRKLTIGEFVFDLAIDLQGASYFLVQCSSETAYMAGHLPNAVRFDARQDLRVDRMLRYLPTDRKIVVSCATGQISAQVVAYLNALGYEAYVLLYGANGVCYSNDTACPTRYAAPDVDHPVMRGHEPDDRCPGGQEGDE